MPKPKEIVIREPAPVDLSSAERTEFVALEKTIEQGLQTFFEVGSALATIRDKRLYRMKFRTFEDYCNVRWAFDRSYAYRLMNAAQVVENLLPMGDILPESERQVRPLSGLTPEQQQAAWGQAVEQAEGNTPTAAQVAAAADQVKGKPARFKADRWYAVDVRNQVIYDDPATSERELDDNPLYYDCAISKSSSLDRPAWTSFKLVKPPQLTRLQPESILAAFGPKARYAIWHEQRTVYRDPIQADQEALYADCQILSGEQLRRLWYSVKWQIYNYLFAPPRKPKAATTADPRLDPVAFYAYVNKAILNHAYASPTSVHTDWPKAQAMPGTTDLEPLVWRLVDMATFSQIYNFLYPPASRSLAPDRYYVWLLSEGKRPDCVLAEPNFATYGEANRWAKARYRYSMAGKGSDLLSDVRKLAEHVVDLNTFDSYAELLPTASPAEGPTFDPSAFYPYLPDQHIILAEPYKTRADAFANWPGINIAQFPEKSDLSGWRVVGKDEFAQLYQKAAEDVLAAIPEDADLDERFWADPRNRTAENNALLDSNDPKDMIRLQGRIGYWHAALAGSKVICQWGFRSLEDVLAEYPLALALDPQDSLDLADWTVVDDDEFAEAYDREHSDAAEQPDVIQPIQPAAEDLPDQVDHVDHTAPAATPTPDQITMRWAGTEYEAVNRISRDAGQLIYNAYRDRGQDVAEVAIKVAQAVIRATHKRDTRADQAQQLLTSLGYEWKNGIWQRGKK